MRWGLVVVLGGGLQIGLDVKAHESRVQGDMAGKKIKAVCERKDELWGDLLQLSEARQTN
jgi:hypothetical protein